MEYTNMSKQELALLYAPELTPHSAVNRLMAWLKRSSETMDALYRSGYTDRTKIFNPRQIAIIIDFLGEP